MKLQDIDPIGILGTGLMGPAIAQKIMKMRACDHKVIQDLHVVEYVPPEQQKVSFNIPLLLV